MQMAPDHPRTRGSPRLAGALVIAIVQCLAAPATAQEQPSESAIAAPPSAVATPGAGPPLSLAPRSRLDGQKLIGMGAAGFGVGTLAFLGSSLLMGSAVGKTGATSFGLAMTTGLVVSTLASTATVSLLSWGSDVSPAWYWALLGSALVRGASFAGVLLVPYAAGWTQSADENLIPAAVTSLVLGVITEVVLANRLLGPDRPAFSQAIKRTGNLFVTAGGDMRASPDYPGVGAGVGVAAGYEGLLGRTSHALGFQLRLSNAWPIDHLGGLIVEAALKYRWGIPASPVRVGPFAGAWVGAGFTTMCWGDMCGALGPTAGAEVGLYVPVGETSALTFTALCGYYAPWAQASYFTPGLAAGFVL